MLTFSDGILKNRPICVAIDPGHGADDPGKIGADGILEKDINLKVACKLAFYLENQGIRVVMTRTDDAPLYEEGAVNKKRSDMNRRLDILKGAQALAAVSIHQNSFTSADVRGAQTFYYTGSDKSRRLAECILEKLKEADPANHRACKEDNTYYLLKNYPGTIVIVECGFLSNPSESMQLINENYQDQIAWKIHMGILQFLSQEQKTL